MVGIIGAMKVETDGIIALLSEKKEETVSGITFVSGLLGGTAVVVARSGVGKVFAAMCAQTMILRYSPSCIVNVGVAGTLRNDLHVCDLVIADKVMQYDMDTSAIGDIKGMVSGVEMIYFPCEERLEKKFFDAAAQMGVRAVSGTVASGDQFLADPVKKQEIASEFGASACEMEGGAIGQVCYVNGVPFGVLRFISDGSGDDVKMDYATFRDIAADYAIRLVRKVFEK